MNESTESTKLSNESIADKVSRNIVFWLIIVPVLAAILVGYTSILFKLYKFIWNFFS